LQDSGASQGGEQALQELHGDLAGACQITDWDGRRVASAGELGQGSDRVWRLARYHQHRN
jgi:hypothetical protein